MPDELPVAPITPNGAPQSATVPGEQILCCAGRRHAGDTSRTDAIRGGETDG